MQRPAVRRARGELRAVFEDHHVLAVKLEREGVSLFYKDPAGLVFHTYSTYARGIDLLNTAYNYLDLVPKGRDEGGRGRRHDEYDR